MTLSHWVSWRSSRLWQFPRHPLFLMTLTVLRGSDLIFCRVPPVCICLVLFSSCRDDGFGEKSTETRCCFPHIVPAPFTVNVSDHCWCSPWLSGCGSVCQTSPLSRYPPCPDPPGHVCGRVSPYIPHTWVGVVLPLTGESTHTIENSYPCEISLLTPIYLLMNSWICIIHFGLQSNTTRLVAQIFPVLVIEHNFS